MPDRDDDSGDEGLERRALFTRGLSWAAAIAGSVVGAGQALAQAAPGPTPRPATDKPTHNASSPPPPQPGAKAPPDVGPTSGAIPRRPFGKTGVTLAALGVGGHHLGDAPSFEVATDIVARALDAGIDFFDNCWEYHNGKCENWLGRALAGKRDRAFVMTKVCTHGRDGALGLRMLEQSLRRLDTDHLDLWQIHAVSFDNDPALAYAKGGILEAMTKAKKQGKVRFVGFTGHKDPDLHLEMIHRGYPFDSVQMPLNPMDHSFFSFEQKVIPEAQKRGIAILGMKSMGGTADVVKAGVLTAQDCLRYAMSLPVATTISGMDSLAVLDQNLAVARGFEPLAEPAMQALRDKCAAYADGRFELYKVSLKFDNPATRHAHGFPADATQKEVHDEIDGGEPTPGSDGRSHAPI